ncbi:hypothetical protein Thiofri_00509 [Thiorhodovibrio frisius]|nr:hypothetical protein Thiofri_00509 [Thiorhodovibrio frisius]
MPLTMTRHAVLPAGGPNPSALSNEIFGALRLQGRHHPLPLHLACFHAYASTRQLPFTPQGLIPGSRLTITRAGLSPARTRGLARPHWPCSSPACLTGVHHKEDDGPLKFPGYPCVYMPRSEISVVSSPLTLTRQRPQPYGALNSSALPCLRAVILMDHNNYRCGTHSRGLHTHYTWLHT